MWLLFILLQIASSFAQETGIEIQNLEKYNSQWSVVHIDPQKAKVHLLGRNPKHRNFRNAFEAAQKKLWNPVVLMNAGMFHESGQPVGLHIEEGTQWIPLNTHKKYGNFYLVPNGVFGITQEGRPFIVETSKYTELKEPVQIATQSGPLMLEKGRIHPKFRPESNNFHIRNAVGVTKEGTVVFVISQNRVRFYDFALLMKEELHCIDALYLDGFV